MRRSSSDLTRRRLVALPLAAPLLLSRPVAAAAGWPERPPTIVVPFPAGNASDILARILAEKLGDRLGQRIVVDNRPGAGGNIGTRHAAQQPRDGYTFLLGASGPLAINRSLFDRLGYDPVQDFEPIGMVAKTTNILTVGRDFPAARWASTSTWPAAHPVA